MVFKTKEEKAQALLELPSEPEGKIDDLDAWQAEQETRRKEIEEATTEDDGEAAPEVPQEPTEEPPVKPVESVDEMLNFTLKRDELPEDLKGYKNPSEIIKQFAHARKYANQVEEKVTTLDEENKTLKEQLEKLRKDAEDRKLAPPPPPPSSSVIDELDSSIKILEEMDQTDYLTAGQSKHLFGEISGKVRNALQELNNIKKEIASTRTEFGHFKETIETTNKKTVENEQGKALMSSLEELQVKFPELKTKKPVINASDCVENDVSNFAKKILGGLYNNYSPKWQHITAIVNAYLRDEPAIKSYCEQNAITPESIGSSKEDIQNYVIIHNVHERSKGNKINPDGTIELLTNPYTGDKVSFRNHVDAYKNLKEESGIAGKELQTMIAEAEKRAQTNLSNAMTRRATESPTLGGLGEGSPDDIGEQLSEKEAKGFLADFYSGAADVEFKMQTQAMTGDRTLFNKVNAALKRLKSEPYAPDPDWPPETEK